MYNIVKNYNTRNNLNLNFFFLKVDSFYAYDYIYTQAIIDA